MKTLKRITDTEDVNRIINLSSEYVTAYKNDDWHKEPLMTKLQNLLLEMVEKYNLTKVEWATLYTKFVLSI